MFDKPKPPPPFDKEAVEESNDKKKKCSKCGKDRNHGPSPYCKGGGA